MYWRYMGPSKVSHHNLKKPTGRLTRLALSLLEYDYKIVHLKKALHHVRNALSRIHKDPIETIKLISKHLTGILVVF